MAVEGKAGAQGDTDSAAADTKTSAATLAAGTADDKGGADKAAADGKGDTKADAAGSEGAKGDEGKKPDDKAAADAASKVVPEKYTLAIPEGATAYVDDADVQYLEAAARKAGWSNADAQAALEEHVATIKAQSDRFAAETKADPTYGGDKLAETQRLAKAVIDRVRPVGHARRDSFTHFLGRGGAGNHIEVIAFLADLGKLMGEDSPAHSRATTSGSKDAAGQLYDHPTSQALDKGRGA